MYTKPTVWAEVDDEGRLVLPPESGQRYGLKPGAHLRIDEGKNDFRLHLPVTFLKKVYIEPTNCCNLDCRTCMRNAWDEELGLMTDETFSNLLAGLLDFSPLPLLFFGGLGEPLAHPRTIEWIAQAHTQGIRVEMITNGTLLLPKRSQELIEAGLDMLWVSIDGATPESYSDVRLGAELPKVIENLSYLKKIRPAGHFPRPELGIAFVAMRRNLQDLPKVITLGRSLGAKHFKVTNVLPYTQDMLPEMLYTRTLRNITYLPSPWLPSLSLPKFDLDETTSQIFIEALNSGCNVELAGTNLGIANDVCTFIESGAISISWDGAACPCPPLSHNFISYLHGVERISRKHVIGNVNERNLKDMWLDEEYVAYRERVHSFAFAPCTPCGGCELSQANEEDCFGNDFPACGGCLWTQGVIQCP